MMKTLEKTQGMVVSRDTAERVISNNQTLVLHNLEIAYEGACYLLCEDMCVGIIHVKKPFKLHISKFHDYFPQHRCTESQRKKWFGKKHVIFAYPVTVLKEHRMRADVDTDNLFTACFELHESKPKEPSREIALRTEKIDSDVVIVAFNTQYNRFVIDAKKESNIAHEYAKHLLNTYGPDIDITYGDFGDVYVPLYTLSGPVKELTEIRKIQDNIKDHPVPRKKTFTFRADNQYTVQKKYDGIPVRIHHFEDVEIFGMNGERYTEKFPYLQRQLHIARGNYIADGILGFDVDTSIPDRFEDYNHDLAYLLGYVHVNGITEEILSLAQTDKETLENAYTSFDIMKMPDRFARSFIRGLAEGTGFEISKRPRLHFEGLAKEYSHRHIKDLSGVELLEYLYPKGLSLPRYQLQVAEHINICAHPDDRFAVIWLHDLLYFEPW